MSRSLIGVLLLIASSIGCARAPVACECPLPELQDTLNTLIADHENNSWPNWRVALIGRDSSSPFGLFLSQALPPQADGRERWRTTDMVRVRGLTSAPLVLLGTCADEQGSTGLFGVVDTAAGSEPWPALALWRVAPDSGKWRVIPTRGSRCYRVLPAG